MNQFDKIEKNIRELFESTAASLPWADRGKVLVSRLCEAISLYYIDKNQQADQAAPIFEIFLHPDPLQDWKDQQDWEKILLVAINATCRELGIYYQSNPEIRLSPQNSLNRQDLLIEIHETPTPAVQTSATSVPSLFKTASNDDPPIVDFYLILQNEKIIPLNKPVMNIGRKSDNQIILNDLRVSRHHAQIRKTDSGFILFDISSSGGTFVNGERINQFRLRPGDVISLSGYLLIFSGEETWQNVTDREKTKEIQVTQDE